MDDVDRLQEALTEMYGEGTVAWQVVMEEWLTRLALRHNRTRWGYKTPQDFHHMDRLETLFPGVRFVFIMRDPRTMMASLKYVHSNDGDPRQFHPLIYALYWKMAYRKVERFASLHEKQVHVVEFEEMVKYPERTASALAEYLDTSVIKSISVRGRNTSFPSDERKSISSTERWICESIAGDAMREAGYELSNTKPRLGDVPDLFATSIRFTLYQLNRFFKSRDRRGSIIIFVAALLKRN